MNGAICNLKKLGSDYERFEHIHALTLMELIMIGGWPDQKKLFPVRPRPY